MSTILGFVLAWAFRTVIVVALGGAVALAFRKKSAATQHLVWRGTLAVVVLLPLMMVELPHVRPRIESSKRISRAIDNTTPIPSTLTTLRIVKYDDRLIEPSESSDPIDYWLVAGLIYLCGVWLAFGRWWTPLQKIQQMTQGSEPLETDFGLVRVVTTDTLTVPVTYGWQRPVILFPDESRSWPDSRVNAAVLHEQAHIRRRDWIWLSAAHWLAALQWFNPALWLVCNRLRSTSEESADDAVLASGLDSNTYASELLKVAEASSAHHAPALGMARPGGVKMRLTRILSSTHDRRLPGPAQIFTIASSLAFFGIVLSSIEVAIAAPKAVEKRLAEHFGQRPKPDVTNDKDVEVHTLSNGVKVCIPFVSAEQFDGRYWDVHGGNSADQNAWQQILPVLSNKWGNRINDTGGRMIGIGVKVTNIYTRDVVVHYRFKGARINEDLGMGPIDRVMELTWTIFTVPASEKQGDIEVGVACTPSQLVEEDAVNSGLLQPTAEYRVDSEETKTDPVTHKDVVIKHVDPKHDTITVKVRVPAEIAHNDLRLVAYDSSGKELRRESYFNEGNQVGDHFEMSSDFSATSPKKIARVALMSRGYEWTTFKGVQFYPADGAPKP
jgi:hypothetical protein